MLNENEVKRLFAPLIRKVVEKDSKAYLNRFKRGGYLKQMAPIEEKMMKKEVSPLASLSFDAKKIPEIRITPPTPKKQQKANKSVRIVEKLTRKELNEKLKFLSENLCSTFSANSPKNFENFSSWKESFSARIEEILIQLLRYLESKSPNVPFDEEKVRVELDQVLKKLYKIGKHKKIDPVACNEIVKNDFKVKEELKRILDIVRTLHEIVDETEDILDTSITMAETSVYFGGPSSSESKKRQIPSKIPSKSSKIPAKSSKPSSNRADNLSGKIHNLSNQVQNISRWVTSTSRNAEILSSTRRTSKPPSSKLPFIKPIKTPRFTPQVTNKMAKDIEPFIYNQQSKIPTDVIERDILYVASQLTNQFCEDLPVNCDKLTKTVIDIAKKLEIREISSKKAVEIVGTVLSNQECLPIDFCQTFIYHINNEYFNTIKFEDPQVNAKIRAEAMNLRNRSKCEERKEAERNGEYVGADVNLNELARKVLEPKISVDDITGSVAIVGIEESNRDENLLAVPAQINITMTYDVAAGYERISESLPPANIASKVIDLEIAGIDNKLAQQNHDDSMIDNLIYTLRPHSIDTQTFWHARGSELPQWFPGVYTVFPNSYNFRPVKVSCDTSAFLEAWRTMTPGRK